MHANPLQDTYREFCSSNRIASRWKMTRKRPRLCWPSKNATEEVANVNVCGRARLIDCVGLSRPKMCERSRQAARRANKLLERSEKSFSTQWRALKMASISMQLLLIFLLAAQIKGTLSAHNNLDESQSAWAPRITIQPNDLIAIEGESAELNCDAEGQPEPTIEWFHNDQPIRSSTNSRTTMGGSIQFLDIRPGGPSGQQSDAGVYHCVARNRLGEARSRNATLQVAYIKEQFRLAPRDKLAAVGDTITFDCLPRAWPEPNFQWRRNGQPLEPGGRYAIQRIAKTELLNSASQASAMAAAIMPLNVPPAQTSSSGSGKNDSNNQVPSSERDSELVDVFGSQLVIKQVEKADEAKYSCLVETKGTHRLIERESAGGQLIASVKPYFIEPPEHKSGQVGDKVAMRCRMAGDPEPVVSWRRQNGQPLSQKTTIDPADKTLIIESLEASDSGVYICEGENNAGSARALAQLQVTSRPKFNVQPTDQTVDSGARVQLKCSGDASPPPMMFWYKEGHRQLMFPPPPAAPSTSPTQQGQNSPGSTPQFTRSLQGAWPQAAALTASLTNSDTSPASNRLFSMPLDHLATTTVSQTSYFGNRIFVDSQGSLNIVNASSSDSGYYACALISQVGSVMAKAKITVRQSPNQLGSAAPASSDPFFSDPLQQARAGSFVSSGKYDLLPPPVIKMGSVNQTLPTNTSTKLLCDVVSQVAYKIQWFFDNQPLQEEPPRITVLDDGNLGIQNLQTSDSGLYTCVVTAANDQNMPVANPFEPLEASMLTMAPPIQQSTAHSCMLKVAGVWNPNINFHKMMPETFPTSPGPPYMVHTNGNEAITIAWAPPADAGALPIKQYVVEHYDTSQEQLGWLVIHRPNGKESLLIGGLSAEGSHFFVVRATNGIGTGPSSAIAGPFRTLLGENHYQLEQQRRRNPTGLDFADSRADANQARERLMSVATSIVGLTPMTSTSIRIQWSISNIGNASFARLNNFHGEFIEGYSIRYRTVGLGESLLGRGSDLFGLNQQESRPPSSLPLLTSYVDEQELMLPSRPKRDVSPYYDYLQPFNEIRVTDHSTEHYTINGLRPFTVYQFFVVPYYKDIDGLPSNMLTARTNEDHPSVAPLVPSIRPINNTAVRLLWPHIPPEHANGIIRGYLIRVNNSDMINGPAANLQIMSMAPRILTLPLESLTIAPLANPSTSDYRNAPFPIQQQHYVVMYDITNLTHKSFYSIQVAGSTSAGPGPWSESKNFVMDPKMIAEQLRSSNNELDDIMSQSFLSNTPYQLDDAAHSRDMSNLYIILSIILVLVCVLLTAGSIYYRRNNQQVATWKKTISEHFTNKFYMPSSVDHHHRGPGSIQQNIYDHQHHLIYSAGSTHMQQPPAATQTMWAAGINNGAPCMTSSGTGSLSSHGNLLPISNDPNSRTRTVNDQMLLMNGTTVNKDRLVRGNVMNGNVLFCQASRTINPMLQQQIIHHGGDYYSVINNVAEYEELADQQQRNQMQMVPNNVLERHQTGSSNSDTSCPSSVTRLLPNQTYNRDLMARSQIEQQQRHEMILQQQIGCNGEVKQPFITMVNGNDPTKYMTQKAALSPYATTNLMSQMNEQQQGQMFSSNQMNLVRQPHHQENFAVHNGGTSMDDSSKILMAQHMNGAAAGPMNSFRTLQRTHNSLQPSIVHSQPTQVQQIFVQQGDQAHHHGAQGNYGIVHQANNHGQGNMMNNGSALDNKSNLYEHIDYNGAGPISNNQMKNILQMGNVHGQQGDLISSSTSSGSVKSPPDNNQAKYRRGSQNQNGHSEAHDLRVFSSVHNQCEPAERQNLTDGTDSVQADGPEDERDDDDPAQADETTAFRRQSAPGEEQRTRQMSKRKRKQQRNRLHNNNQNVG